MAHYVPLIQHGHACPANLSPLSRLSQGLLLSLCSTLNYRASGRRLPAPLWTLLRTSIRPPQTIARRDDSNTPVAATPIKASLD